MGQLPIEISFDAWLDYLFGPPVGPSGFRESDDWWDEQANPTLAVALLTRLFEDPAVLLGRYPHEQIDRGLWFLAFESGHLHPLLGPPVPWQARRRGLLAIGSLYSKLFARVCTNHLGHLDRGPEPPHPLNSICYMWWDLFPTWGGGGGEKLQGPRRRGSRQARRRERRLAGAEAPAGRIETTEDLLSVDEVLLQVMAQTLQLESEPCREGALHGLGHWHLNCPERVEAIVDSWLATEPCLSPDLRRYTLQARGGCVL